MELIAIGAREASNKWNRRNNIIDSRYRFIEWKQSEDYNPEFKRFLVLQIRTNHRRNKFVLPLKNRNDFYELYHYVGQITQGLITDFGQSQRDNFRLDLASLDYMLRKLSNKDFVVYKSNTDFDDVRLFIDNRIRSISKDFFIPNGLIPDNKYISLSYEEMESRLCRKQTSQEMSEKFQEGINEYFNTIRGAGREFHHLPLSFYQTIIFDNNVLHYYNFDDDEAEDMKCTDGQFNDILKSMRGSISDENSVKLFKVMKEEFPRLKTFCENRGIPSKDIHLLRAIFDEFHRLFHFSSSLIGVHGQCLLKTDYIRTTKGCLNDRHDHRNIHYYDVNWIRLKMCDRYTMELRSRPGHIVRK